jgi:ABC-type Fe3+-siderophore transport system permease subunit
MTRECAEGFRPARYRRRVAGGLYNRHSPNAAASPLRHVRIAVARPRHPHPPPRDSRRAHGGPLGSLGVAVVGSIDVSASAIVRALAGDTSDTASAIVRELRLPRALAAFAVGALLALAGALMQVLLRNPLADPYILGISGGAAAGALGAMLAGAASVVTPAALGGALASTVLVFALARTGVDRAPWTTTRLLLTGVVAAGWGR